jgi:hypothetical protein
MNRLSLRNNRLQFKTSRNLPIILGKSKEYTLPQIDKGKLKGVNMKGTNRTWKH